MMKAMLGEIGFFCFLCVSSLFAGEMRFSIEETCKKPALQRIQICVSVLEDPLLSPDLRNPFLRLFAQDAKNISPQYGKSTIAIPEKQWTDFLSSGVEVFPEDRDVVLALAQLLINDRQYARAIKILEPYHQQHPCHETSAWLDYCRLHADEKSAAARGEESFIFDVHFCVLTGNPEAHKECTPEQFQQEILILNHTFRTLDRKSPVTFRLKSASRFEDIDPETSLLAQMANIPQPLDSNKFTEAYNQCASLKLRDPSAINIYIYDSYDVKTEYKDVTCHGRRNSNRPYLLIDWQRLNNEVQSPEAHEMGHAFGLEHVAVPGAVMDTPTNIMCSTEQGFGSGGNRRLGFTEAQTAIILYHAKRTQQRLSVAQP